MITTRLRWRPLEPLEQAGFAVCSWAKSSREMCWMYPKHISQLTFGDCCPVAIRLGYTYSCKILIFGKLLVQGLNPQPFNWQEGFSIYSLAKSTREICCLYPKHFSQLTFGDCYPIAIGQQSPKVNCEMYLGYNQHISRLDLARL